MERLDVEEVLLVEECEAEEEEVSVGAVDGGLRRRSSRTRTCRVFEGMICSCQF